MLLGGLWHGASWNFVIWGGIHGGMLAWERSRGEGGLYRTLPHPLRVVFTFLVVLVAWVFFRAEDLAGAARYLQSMAGLAQAPASAGLLGGVLYQPYYVLCLLAAAVVVWARPDTWEWTQRLTWPKAALCLALFWLSLLFLATQAYNPFIYFFF